LIEVKKECYNFKHHIGFSILNTNDIGTVSTPPHQGLP